MRRLKYYIPPLCWMAVIFVFSTSVFSVPATGSVLGRILDLFWNGYTHRELEFINHLIRKSAHVVVYGILALLWVRALVCGAGYGRKKAVLLALLITMSVAVSDEAHQLLVPGRGARLDDAAIDTCAGAIALLAWGGNKKSAVRVTAPR